jgi:hypothetical protein
MTLGKERGFGVGRLSLLHCIKVNIETAKILTGCSYFGSCAFSFMEQK